MGLRCAAGRYANHLSLSLEEATGVQFSMPPPTLSRLGGIWWVMEVLEGNAEEKLVEPDWTRDNGVTATFPVEMV